MGIRRFGAIGFSWGGGIGREARVNGCVRYFAGSFVRVSMGQDGDFGLSEV